MGYHMWKGCKKHLCNLRNLRIGFNCALLTLCGKITESRPPQLKQTSFLLELEKPCKEEAKVTQSIKQKITGHPSNHRMGTLCSNPHRIRELLMPMRKMSNQNS
ncbi:hypothetical protein ACJJTC_000877 [Scirpophaga incertulas]